MKFGQNVPWLSMRKGCEAFFDIPNDTCPFTRSRDKDRQLKNRFSQQEIGISKKPHTLL